jgi:parallel beta-helix repeat protein
MGIVLSEANNSTINNNEFYNIREHGINGSSSSNVTMSNNVFSDFFPGATDHPDAIWFGAVPGNTSSSNNLVINNNLVARGAGAPTQGLFFKDSTGVLPFQNLTITNNTVIGAGYTAIGITGAQNATVTGNQVSAYSDFTSFILLQNVTGGVATNNSAASYGFQSDTGVIQSANATSATVTDGGKALVGAWLALNPGAVASLPATLAALVAGSAAPPNSTLTATSANISGSFDSLNSSSTYHSIVVSDNAAIQLTVAQLTNDTHALGELSNANGTAYSVTVSDTAANLSASFNALNTATHVGSIVISDNGALSLTAAQLLGDAATVAKLKGSGGAQPVLNVVDTAANVAANLSALAAATNLHAITVSNGLPLPLTVAQVTADAAVLAKISGGYSIALSDTAANVSADLDGLNANTAVGSVVVSNNAAVTLTSTQWANDTRVLGEMTNQNGSAVSLTVTDTAAKITAALGALTSGAHIGSIVLSDNGAVSVTAAQAAGDASALAKLIDANGTAAVVKVSDTAANITAALAALNSDTQVKSIVISDNAALTITAAQQSADAKALSELVDANGAPVVINVTSNGSNGGAGGAGGSVYTNTAANIEANLASLNANSTISSVVVSNNAPIVMTAAQWANDSHLLGELSNQNGSPYSVKITDTAANVSANLDALSAAHHIGAIVLSDNAVLTMTAAQAGDTALLALVADANGHSVLVKVADTAADLTSALTALRTDSHVTALTVTDGGTIEVPIGVYGLDAALLAKITGAHAIEVTGLTGQTATSELLTYNAAGVMAETTMNNINGSVTVAGLTGGLTFNSSSHAQTITVTNGGDTFVFNPGFASETIVGFQAATDSLSFSHTLFASAAAALASASNDGHGDVVFHIGAGETITLDGVTLAQLQAHQSAFHFF